MSTPKCLLGLSLVLALGSSGAAAQTPGLGKPITEAEIKAWDISVMPDGTGLPPGSGTAAQGAKVFAEKCSACHGENAKGGPGYPQAMFGNAPVSNAIETPKTIGNFIGYPTIVFDFIRRAMPFNQPRTLTSDEVYALTAYLLALNKVIGDNDTMNAETLPKVKMPNRDNFIIRFPDRI
jgi:S-disulfanyl-L-cysteine oxidoreductase SoxD